MPATLYERLSCSDPRCSVVVDWMAAVYEETIYASKLLTSYVDLTSS
ncbi:MAG: hypothetical protein ACI9MR_000532 [Myxococcota bacterium]|jgi:hypothetical protein